MDKKTKPTKENNATTKLTEERVREIAREEAIKYAAEGAEFVLAIDAEAARLSKKSRKKTSNIQQPQLPV